MNLTGESLAWGSGSVSQPSYDVMERADLYAGTWAFTGFVWYRWLSKQSKSTDESTIEATST